ncbi:hypothetical protein KGR20_18495 [Cytobacillus oceanisediminis]|uniref:hypothetical protein n=1 Tax=Bacillaceae TaxID=186817 RepID=UPI001CC91FEE|nr:hypothetical protein [Cytobacillus oceanisediminis]MBZ9536168.1 hypothetical protein [Cytobacillus oceanisediminis]
MILIRMFGDISQKFDISAKRKKKSAKSSIYQPNARRNQPKIRYISQTQKEISQKFNISAKRKKKSAKNSIYQPNQTIIRKN